MKYDPDRHHRRSIRLKDYNYTQAGAYFVTVCTYQRESVFGDVAGEQMRLNEYGCLTQDEWLRTASVRPYVALDQFVIMPNHIHGIIVITDPVGATRRVAPTTVVAAAGRGTPRGPASGSIGAVIGQFKSLTARRINKLRETPGTPVWQRNYYEHIIRDESSLDQIRQYILDNPARWANDPENPQAQDPEPEEAWRLS